MIVWEVKWHLTWNQQKTRWFRKELQSPKVNLDRFHVPNNECSGRRILYQKDSTQPQPNEVHNSINFADSYCLKIRHPSCKYTIVYMYILYLYKYIYICLYVSKYIHIYNIYISPVLSGLTSYTQVPKISSGCLFYQVSSSQSPYPNSQCMIYVPYIYNTFTP